MKISYEEVSKILETSKNIILNNRNYRMLLKGVFQKFWEERKNKRAYFSIFFDSGMIDKINLIELKRNLDLLNSMLIGNNFIQINENGKIENSYYKDFSSYEMKQELAEISKKNCVFFFGEGGITPYINGNAVEDNNIFYSREDRQKYLEKRDISKLEEVIHEYATECVTEQVNYMNFFVDTPTLKQIDKKYVTRNILRNKPEHFMRDHLMQYLNANMRYTFTKEPELAQSKRRLDIYFDVNGELHLIEIKWLGVAINNAGDGLTKPYGDARVKEGVIQTLEYIEELSNTTETCLRGGYLAVFDARDQKEDVDLEGFNFVSGKLKPYMQCFKLLDMIPLEKKHPA